MVYPTCLSSRTRDGATSAMHPDDLATHRANRARRDRRALAASLRLAYLAATTSQQLELARIVTAVERDDMTVAQARDLVADIRSSQQARAA